MLSQGQEMAAIDFADIIGGPLIAVINAQAKAANVTASFIQQTAFTQTTTGGTGSNSQTLAMVTFDFSQMLGSTAGQGLKSLSTINVPLLSLLPIPFIRVESMTLTFNVNLQNTSSVTLSNNFQFTSTTSTSESGFLGIGPAVTFQATVSDQNTYQNNQVVDDTYSLNVVVNAVQDQMPGGMQQILGIFGNLIQSQAGILQSVMTEYIQGQQKQVQSGGTTGVATGGGGG